MKREEAGQGSGQQEPARGGQCEARGGAALRQGQTMSPYGKQTELPRPPRSRGLLGSGQQSQLTSELGSLCPGR